MREYISARVRNSLTDNPCSSANLSTHDKNRFGTRITLSLVSSKSKRAVYVSSFLRPPPGLRGAASLIPLGRPVGMLLIVSIPCGARHTSRAPVGVATPSRVRTCICHSMRADVTYPRTWRLPCRQEFLQCRRAPRRLSYGISLLRWLALVLSESIIVSVTRGLRRGRVLNLCFVSWGSFQMWGADHAPQGRQCVIHKIGTRYRRRDTLLPVRI